MAKLKSQTTSLFREKPKKNNKGVHATTQTSKSKTADNYKKPYKGQGR
jgi:hypothetical protein